MKEAHGSIIDPAQIEGHGTMQVRYARGGGCVKHKGMGQVRKRQLCRTVRNITAGREDKGTADTEDKINRKEKG